MKTQTLKQYVPPTLVKATRLVEVTRGAAVLVSGGTTGGGPTPIG